MPLVPEVTYAVWIDGSDRDTVRVVVDRQVVRACVAAASPGAVAATTVDHRNAHVLDVRDVEEPALVVERHCDRAEPGRAVAGCWPHPEVVVPLHVVPAKVFHRRRVRRRLDHHQVVLQLLVKRTRDGAPDRFADNVQRLVQSVDQYL